MVMCGATQCEALTQQLPGMVALLEAAVAATTAGQETPLGTERCVHATCQRVTANRNTTVSGFFVMEPWHKYKTYLYHASIN